MLNSFDPDQARHFVWPDLGPNCLQRSSADDTSRKELITWHKLRGPVINWEHLLERVFF